MATKPARPENGAGEGALPLLRKRLLAALGVGLACLCLSTCGLEDISYYESPSFIYGSNILTLTHNTSNVENFLGYDVYYRAYQTEALANTARATIESAIGTSGSTPDSVISTMTTNKFVKMYLASTPTVAPTPLCKVASPSSSIAFNFLLDKSTANWYFTTSTDSSSTPTYVVRGLGRSSNNSFNYGYLTSDSTDYSYSTDAIESGDTVYLVFFAVGYGYDFDKLAAKYSFPVSLYETVAYTLP
jgi:hypothetical protein